MSNSYTVSSAWVKMIVDSWEHYGLDSKALCCKTGIEYDDLNAPDIRICQNRVSALWQAAEEKSGNPAIGLSVARPASISALDAFVYVFMSCESLKEAFNQLIRFRHNLADNLGIEMIRRGNKYWVTHNLSSKKPVSIQVNDAMIGACVALSKWATLGKVLPAAVHFTQASPENRVIYDNVFDCPIHFNQDENAVIFRVLDVEEPLLTANKRVAEQHQQVLLQVLNPIVKQVREQLMEELGNGMPSVDDMAARFDMSQRTFQRRLTKEGWNYRDLVDDVRKILAKRYVCGDKYNAQEIIRMLEFTEHTTFIRAFKRWYQYTPTQYKRLLSQGKNART